MIKNRKIIIVSSVLTVMLASATAVAYWHTHRTVPAKTTSNSPTAQNDYSEGAPRDSNAGSGNSQGSATDTHGQDASDAAGGVSSESGAITVQSPAQNASLASGAVLAGKVTGVDKVQYRVIDNDVGVIAQGALASEGGLFSGKLQFVARAATGRVDVFSFDSRGEEINVIEIPVRFKQ